MDLTINEMRALKRLAEDAITDNKHSAAINKYPEVKERWEILETYLSTYKLGSCYGTDIWTFHEGKAIALARRLGDLIEDAKTREKNAAKMTLAAWLSAFAAAVSALAALVALCS